MLFQAQAHLVPSLTESWYQPFLQRTLVLFSGGGYLEAKIWVCSFLLACHCSQGLLGHRSRGYIYVYRHMYVYTHTCVSTHSCVDFIIHMKKDEFVPIPLIPVQHYSVYSIFLSFCICAYLTVRNLAPVIHRVFIYLLNPRIHRNEFQNYSPRARQNINLPARIQNVFQVLFVLILSPQKPLNTPTFGPLPGRRDPHTHWLPVMCEHVRPTSLEPPNTPGSPTAAFRFPAQASEACGDQTVTSKWQRRDSNPGPCDS